MWNLTLPSCVTQEVSENHTTNRYNTFPLKIIRSYLNTQLPTKVFKTRRIGGEHKINHFILQIWRLTLDFAWTLRTVYLHLNQLSQTKIFLCYWSNPTATCSSCIRALHKRFPRVSQDFLHWSALLMILSSKKTRQ